jgi:antitoxin Phd
MWTLQDAKNKFSAVVDAALAGQPQQVSRRGKPAVVVISVEEFARLNAAVTRDRGSFLDYLLARPVLEGEEDWLIPDRTRAVPRDIAF